MFPTECDRTDGSVPEGLPELRELPSEDVWIDGKPSQVLQGLSSTSCEVVDALEDGSRSEGSIQRHILDDSAPDACHVSATAPTPVAITDQNLAAIRELIVPVTMSNSVARITDLEPTAIRELNVPVTMSDSVAQITNLDHAASMELSVPDGSQRTAIRELNTFFDEHTVLEPDTVHACVEGNLNSVKDKMSGETVKQLAVIRKRSSDAEDDLAGFPPAKRFKVSLGNGLKVSRRPVTTSNHLATSNGDVRSLKKLVRSSSDATGSPIVHHLSPRSLHRKLAFPIGNVSLRKCSFRETNNNIGNLVSDRSYQLVHRNRDLVKQNAKLVSQHKELIKQNEAQVDKSNELEIRNHQLCETNKELSYKLEILKHLLSNPYKLGVWTQLQRDKAVADVR